MKKPFLILSLMLVMMMFGTTAMAQLPAPTGLTCEIVEADITAVCCDWEDVDGAKKYSLDAEAEVDTTGDGVADMTVELSFGTSDREDGGPMGDSDLCTDLDNFVYLVGEDTVQLSGPVDIKVKALNPGKGKGKQNNPFSTSVEVILP
jgi:hypothetical protein